MPQSTAGENGVVATFLAGADLSAHQYHFMRLSAAGTVNVASLSTIQTGVGVLLNKPAASGRAARVLLSGETMVVAGGTVTAPDFITCNSAGRAVAAASGDAIFGLAVTTAAAGEYLRAVIGAFPVFNGNVA